MSHFINNVINIDKVIYIAIYRLEKFPDELNTDTDSLSKNQSKLTLRKTLLAKTYKEFNLPYSSVIDINQLHYELIFPAQLLQLSTRAQNLTH